jgi:hypothetical protein
MRKLTVDRRVRLITVALLVSAGFSAGMRHAHPGGGGWQHRHDHAPDLLAAAQVPPASRAGWFSTPLHMHIFVLGFQFTLPADEESDDESSHHTDHPVAMLAADDLADSAARVPIVTCQALAPAAPQAAFNLAGAVPVRRRLLPLRSLPLCESARHERSGVQRT